MSVRDTHEVICPECLKDEYLEVTASIDVRLTSEGSDADRSMDGSHTWDDKSPCTCTECGWTGTVGDAQIANKVYGTLADKLAAAKAALETADSFMTGFEDDELQEGIDEMLEEIRGAIAALEETAP